MMLPIQSTYLTAWEAAQCALSHITVNATIDIDWSVTKEAETWTSSASLSTTNPFNRVPFSREMLLGSLAAGDDSFAMYVGSPTVGDPPFGSSPGAPPHYRARRPVFFQDNPPTSGDLYLSPADGDTLDVDWTYENTDDPDLNDSGTDAKIVRAGAFLEFELDGGVPKARWTASIIDYRIFSQWQPDWDLWDGFSFARSAGVEMIRLTPSISASWTYNPDPDWVPGTYTVDSWTTSVVWSIVGS
jgi:hypothetical protein